MIDFEKLRAEWALRWLINKDTVDMYKRLDQAKNPHNENYHNKHPRRTTAEIISDCSYTFADDVLKQQYGYDYSKWLQANCDQSPFTQVWKQRH